MQEMLLQLWMVTHAQGWRCDCWGPRVRLEPTSSVHALVKKMRPGGLAVGRCCKAVGPSCDRFVIIPITNGYTRYSSQVSSLV